MKIDVFLTNSQILKMISWLFVVLTTFSFYGQSHKQEMYECATNYMYQGKIFEAIGYYNEALRMDTAFSEAYLDRGIAKEMILDYEGAINDFNSYIKLDSESADAYFLRGLLEYNMREYSNAKRDLLKVIQIDDGNADAHFYLSQSQLMLGDRTNAKIQLLETLRVNADHILAKKELALYYYLDNDNDSALKLYIELTYFEPQERTNFLKLSQIYQNIGDINKACVAYSNYVQLSDNQLLEKIGLKCDE